MSTQIVDSFMLQLGCINSLKTSYIYWPILQMCALMNWCTNTQLLSTFIFIRLKGISSYIIICFKVHVLQFIGTSHYLYLNQFTMMNEFYGVLLLIYFRNKDTVPMKPLKYFLAAFSKKLSIHSWRRNVIGAWTSKN